MGGGIPLGGRGGGARDPRAYIYIYIYTYVCVYMYVCIYIYLIYIYISHIYIYILYLYICTYMFIFLALALGRAGEVMGKPDPQHDSQGSQLSVTSIKGDSFDHHSTPAIFASSAVPFRANMFDTALLPKTPSRQLAFQQVSIQRLDATSRTVHIYTCMCTSNRAHIYLNVRSICVYVYDIYIYIYTYVYIQHAYIYIYIYICIYTMHIEIYIGT